MKTIYSSIQKSIPLFLIGMFVLLLTSCGSHNNGYTDSERNSSVEGRTSTNEGSETSDNNKSNYYKQYFKSKESAYAEVLEEETEEGAIFTDIDAYHSSETIDEDGYVVIEEKNNDYEEGYGAWGSNSDNVTINIYGGGHYGYGYGYWHRPYWWHGSSWGYPYYRPYWGISYGWGYPYYWGGYYSPYYYGYHGHYYNNYNSYAYNRGRRNNGIYTRNTRGRSSSSVANRRGNYSSSEVSRRTSRSNVSRRSNSKVNRRSNSTTRPTQNSTRRRSTNVNTNRRTKNNTVRRNNTTRRTNTYSRPSTNTRRSSGSSRGSSGRRGRG